MGLWMLFPDIVFRSGVIVNRILLPQILLIAVTINISCLRSEYQNASFGTNDNTRRLSITNDSESKEPIPDSRVVIELERMSGECPTCPVYLLSIYVDGRIAFRGIRNFRILGDQEFTISESTLESLEEKFLENNFFLLSDRYVDGKLCPERWTDAPTSRLFFRQQRKTKTVYHYQGCKGTMALEQLEMLEDAVDTVLPSPN